MRRDVPEPPSSEITPESVYVNRRAFMRNAARAVGTAAVVGAGLSWLVGQAPAPDPPIEPTLVEASALPKGSYDTDEPETSYDNIATYNNYYEFGEDKGDPAQNAHTLTTRPWTITVEGEVAKPQVIDIDTLLQWFPLEQRIYRMRCVEAWSMVIPSLGFPLADLIKRLEPTGNAKFVEFTALLRPKEMPGQLAPILDWPYVEGLRLDEALHPLTMLAVGLYGKVLPNQN